jgi:hypothetical protein
MVFLFPLSNPIFYQLVCNIVCLDCKNKENVAFSSKIAKSKWTCDLNKKTNQKIKHLINRSMLKVFVRCQNHNLD